MTDAFLQMPLTQMVDLVINSPEEGVVNFNLLHTVLHVIVKQLNAQNVSVELHGAGAQRLQNLINSDGATTGPSMNITVVNAGANAGAGKGAGKGTGTEAGAATATSTAKGAVSTMDAGAGVAKGAASKSATGTGEAGGVGAGTGTGGGPTTRDVASESRTEKRDTATETVYVVQPVESSPNCGMTVTKRQLDSINEEMTIVKAKLQELTELPGNLGIIDAVRTETCSPVFDMFQILSLSKRVDAAEIGMSKLASIVEDLIKNPAYADRGTACSKLSKSELDNDMRQKMKSKGTMGQQDELGDELRERLNGMSPNEAIAFLMEEIANLKEILELSGICAEGEDKMSLAEVFDIATQIRDKFLRRSGEEGDDHSDLPPDVQLALLEDRFAEYTRHIEDMDRTFNDELSKLHNQFTDIEKDFNEILLKIQGGLPAGDSDSNQCCAAVYNKIAKLQTDFETLTDTSTKLIEDKEEKQQKMDLMLEQIELLKTIKADKEDIEEALAEKADACTVHRKVSHDQFDNACDELYKGIEEALSKLSQQEELWQHALDDIQNEIGTKLDKMDLGPLREFINNKLRHLQDKMRSLAALKREQEAAGTKSKLLRDVNCISCDKDVVMRKEMDPSLKPQAYSVPPNRSMAPYLAYELDALRKQQKGVPGARNMNNLEAALASKGSKKADDHICNRYCGGSHTLTTPQQRVTRLGHFLLQWGPEAIPKDEVKKAEKEVQTRSQSVVVQGDILSTRRSSAAVEPSSPSKVAQSKSAMKPVSRASVGRTSQTPRGSITDEKKLSETKRQSQISNKSVRSAKSAIKSKVVVEEPIAESPAEEGQAEAAEPPTESEATAPPPTRNDDVDGEGEGQGPAEVQAEAAPTAEEAAPPPADEAPPPPEEG